MGVGLIDQGMIEAGGIDGAGGGKGEEGGVEDGWGEGAGREMGELRERLLVDRVWTRRRRDWVSARVWTSDDNSKARSLEGCDLDFRKGETWR